MLAPVPLSIRPAWELSLFLMVQHGAGFRGERTCNVWLRFTIVHKAVLCSSFVSLLQLIKALEAARGNGKCYLHALTMVWRACEAHA